MAEKTEKRNKRDLVIGVVIAFFALTGLITLISLAISGIKTVAATGKNKKAAEYKAYLAPVVMNDPDPFDDVINADQSQLIGISIWALLRSDIDPDAFESADGGMVVKAELIENEYKKLFGTDAAPVHQTVDGGEGLQFVYKKDINAYIVPITGITAVYSPVITDIKEKGSSAILTVGYLAGEEWELDEKGDMVPPEPVKYMKIYLRKNADGYYISSIKQADRLDTSVKEEAESEKTTEKGDK